MQTKNPEAAAQVRAELQDAIARLEACTLTDQILGWPDLHLAVLWTEDGQGRVVNPEAASPWRPGLPPISNGHGTRAIRCERQDVIRASAANLRRIISENL